MTTIAHTETHKMTTVNLETADNLRQAAEWHYLALRDTDRAKTIWSPQAIERAMESSLVWAEHFRLAGLEFGPDWPVPETMDQYLDWLDEVDAEPGVYRRDEIAKSAIHAARHLRDAGELIASRHSDPLVWYREAGGAGQKMYLRVFLEDGFTGLSNSLTQDQRLALMQGQAVSGINYRGENFTVEITTQP